MFTAEIGPSLAIPLSIQEQLRSFKCSPHTFLTEFKKVNDNDIWVADAAVKMHSDNTVGPGYLVVGLILLNDLGLELQHGDVRFALPVGATYRMNGLKQHGAPMTDPAATGNFAALIWDVPPHKTWPELMAEFAERLAELTQ